MRMKIKIKNAKVRRVVKVALALVGLWLIIFEIPIFFTPLRFMPEEITVWRQGESVTLTKSDIDYYGLYHRLREAGKDTIAHVVTHDVIMDSHRTPQYFWEDEQIFCDNAIVVYVKYGSMQKGRLWGAVGDEYNLVVFTMATEQVEPLLEGGGFLNTPLYRNTEGDRKSYSAFVNYGSLDKAEEYINAMDFGGQGE